MYIYERAAKKHIQLESYFRQTDRRTDRRIKILLQNISQKVLGLQTSSINVSKNGDYWGIHYPSYLHLEVLLLI